jgi:DNA-binding LytR/AlgR family response regulator
MAMSLLEEYVGQVGFLELCYKAESAMSALNYLNAHETDLVFLDINLPDISGLDLTDLLKGRLKVIFTTAYSTYAVQSYEKNALDYLLKPITFNRFLQAALKAKAAFDSLPASSQADPKVGSFFVKSGKKIIHFNWSDIHYLEGYKEYVAVTAATGKTLVYKRMKEMEELLPSHFIRVHKSFFVNTEKVEKIEDNHVHVLGRQVPIGRKYKEAFYQKLQDRML